MSSQRLPDWIREKKLNLSSLREMKTMLRERELHSVCESLACPNRTECFSRGTATFMILGDVCTRSCGFCNVTTGRPYAPPSPEEPRAVAETARRLGLKHVVVTCVTRDDLEDGGAQQFAETIRELRAALPQAAVEVLTSDFRGNFDSVRTVVEARPDYFNHNVETVPRLYDFVRPGSRFERSLGVLREAKRVDAGVVTKSGLMLGLGERPRRGRRRAAAPARRRRRDRHDRPIPAAEAREARRRRVRSSIGLRGIPRHRPIPRLPRRFLRSVRAELVHGGHGRPSGGGILNLK